MKIIPVLDLKNGLVVHAQQGRRDHYRPINTPLTASADVFDVVAAFLSLYPFDTFYIADLDAITGTGNHNPLIENLQIAHPELAFWLDQGYRANPQNLGKHWPVLGTESYGDNRLDELARFGKGFILSLDYLPDALPTGKLFTDSTWWPEQVIIMTLAKVGSQSGPDFDKLAEYVRRYPEKKFIAAGGIRSAEDMLRLSEIGVTRALVASGLHSGAITARDIAELH